MFVSDNGGAITPLVTGSTGTSALFIGTIGHTYAFYSVAADNVGLREAAPATPDAVTTIILNAAPLMDSIGSPYLTAPAGTRLATDMSNGVLVSELLARGAGGDPIADADAGAVEGIALTGITKIEGAFGTWEYTLVANPQASDWIKELFQRFRADGITCGLPTRTVSDGPHSVRPRGRFARS